MSDLGRIVPPPQLPFLKEKSRSLSFNMACEDTARALLRTLAASKKGGACSNLEPAPAWALLGYWTAWIKNLN